MNLDQNAIQQIQESSNLPEVIAQLNQATSGSPAIVVPGSMNVHSLEKYMPKALRYRAKYETSSIDDFVTYAKKFKEEGTACFIDADSMCAQLIIDLGTTADPGHQAHTSVLSLRRTAAFKALLEINGSHLPQKKVADFIEDWAELIIAHDREGDSMTAQQAANSLKELTIELAKASTSKVHDFGGELSDMEKIEAKSSGLLPAYISFSCTPFHGLSERTFKLRVGILTGGELAISMRIQLLEAIEEEMADEFKDLLAKGFGEDIQTYIGTAR